MNNPFGYASAVSSAWGMAVPCALPSSFPTTARQPPGGKARTPRPRIAHGCSARLFLAAPLFKSMTRHFQVHKLENYAWDQLQWINGRNPYDASMLMGSGHGNAPYMFFRSYKYTSAPGGIINGITAAGQDEDGIAFSDTKKAMYRDWSRRRLALDRGVVATRSVVSLRCRPESQVITEDPARGKLRPLHIQLANGTMCPRCRIFGNDSIRQRHRIRRIIFRHACGPLSTFAGGIIGHPFQQCMGSGGYLYTTHRVPDSISICETLLRNCTFCRTSSLR